MRWCFSDGLIRKVYRGLKQWRVRYVLACLVLIAVCINFSLFQSVLHLKPTKDSILAPYSWNKPSPGAKDDNRLFEGIHDHNWVLNIPKNVHANISSEQISRSSDIKSILNKRRSKIKPIKSSSNYELVSMLEAVALERLSCIMKRSEQMNEIVLRTRAKNTAHKLQQDQQVQSPPSVHLNSAEVGTRSELKQILAKHVLSPTNHVGESPLCVKESEGGDDRKEDQIEGAQPSLKEFYPTRNFQRLCTDNVLLKQPADFVTVGHIKPNIHLAIGVPTVSRPGEGYLVNTLKDLFTKASSDEMKDVAIVVFLADLATSSREVSQKTHVKAMLQKSFPKEINSGNLIVIEAPPEFYPPLTNLKRNFNDDPSRVYWRAKQCLDFSFIFSFAHSISQYYLHLEDDVITKTGYITSVKNSASHMNGKFLEMEFSVLGFIAKLFRSVDLLNIAAFHFYYHEEMPVDFLQPIYLALASPENPIPVPHYPSLFQHKGKSSSLKGKRQPIQDPFYDSYRMFSFKKVSGFNAFTNIPFTASNRPEMTIGAAGMFWSKGTPKPKDHFTIWSDSEVRAEYMVIVSGNPKHPNDTAVGARVEASRKIVERNRKSVICQEPYTQIGIFEHSVFAVNLTNFGQFHCIRIVFTKERKHWLLISEIAIAQPNEYMMIRDPVYPDEADKFVHLPSFLRTRYELYVRRGFKYI